MRCGTDTAQPFVCVSECSSRYGVSTDPHDFGICRNDPAYPCNHLTASAHGIQSDCLC